MSGLSSDLGFVGIFIFSGRCFFGGGACGVGPARFLSMAAYAHFMLALCTVMYLMKWPLLSTSL